MQVWGYVLLVGGILFSILFALADLGGGHLGVIPYFVAGMLIVMGWRMGRAGKGLLKSPATGTATGQTANLPGGTGAVATDSATIELPLTPEVAVVLARHNARARRFLLLLSGAFLVFFIGLGAVLDATDPTAAEGRAMLEAFGAVGILTALAIYGISWLTTLKPVRKDLSEKSYLRTTGPVEVVPMFGGAMLRLADRAFLMNGRGGTAELRTLGWGRVDYSPHGHVVLGAWDRDGRSIYHVPGYAVTDDLNDAANAGR